MLEVEPDELLVANEVVGGDHLRRLADVARRTRLVVVVDDPENGRQLSAAAERGGVEIGVLVDVDVGMRRCGVRSAGEAVALAGELAALPGLCVRGVMGYEGQVVMEPDVDGGAAGVQAAMDVLTAQSKRSETPVTTCRSSRPGGRTPTT